MCCPDKASCCPSGFTCNTATQMCEQKKQPWMNIPMVKKDAAEQPSTPLLTVSSPQELANNHIAEQQKTSIVPCDSYYHCPDRYTCCHHPKGGWFCCPYYPVSWQICDDIHFICYWHQLRAYRQLFVRCYLKCVPCREGVVWMATTVVHTATIVTTRTLTVWGMA